MANRVARRVATSKKGGPRKAASNGKSNGSEAVPKLTPAQQKRLRKIKDSIEAVKCRIADLEMEKSRLMSGLSQQQANLQEAIKSAMQGAGVDFEEGPQGNWGIDLKTMQLSFTPQDELGA